MSTSRTRTMRRLYSCATPVSNATPTRTAVLSCRSLGSVVYSQPDRSTIAYRDGVVLFLSLMKMSREVCTVGTVLDTVVRTRSNLFAVAVSRVLVGAWCMVPKRCSLAELHANTDSTTVGCHPDRCGFVNKHIDTSTASNFSIFLTENRILLYRYY